MLTQAQTTRVGVARWLALGAIAGPILFTVAWVVLGLLRPGYSFVSQPISKLGIGPNGAFMDEAFVLNGILLIASVIAISQSWRELGTVTRWVCTVLLAISPFGSLLTGIFPANPETLGLHLLGVQLAVAFPIIALPIAGLLLRRASSWRTFGTWILLSGPLTLVLLIGFITSIPFSQMATGGGSYGLWQRAVGTEVLAWYVVLGWLAFRPGARRDERNSTR